MGKDIAQNAVLPENIQHHGGHHDPGNKIRKKQERLRNLFEHSPRDLAKHQGKSHLKQDAEHNKRQIVQKRVFGQIQKLSGNFQVFKILKPAPGASENPVVIIIVFKRYGNSEHGDVAEHHHVKQGGQQHGDQCPVFSYLPAEPVFSFSAPICFHRHPPVSHLSKPALSSGSYRNYSGSDAVRSIVKSRALWKKP